GAFAIHRLVDDERHLVDLLGTHTASDERIDGLVEERSRQQRKVIVVPLEPCLDLRCADGSRSGLPREMRSLPGLLVMDCAGERSVSVGRDTTCDAAARSISTSVKLRR